MNKKVSFAWQELIFYLSLVFILVVFPFFGLFANVSGESMYPTLHDKDYLFVSKISSIEKGDIVIIKREDSEKYLVKRVIGVSGDEIEFKDNALYLNDELISEDYINHDEDVSYTDYSEVVSEDCFYVLGDNRNHSGDSRSFGDVKSSEIKGVVKLNLTSLGITNTTVRVMTLLFMMALMFLYAKDKGSNSSI